VITRTGDHRSSAALLFGVTEPVAERQKRLVVLTADLADYSELVFRDAEAGVQSLVESRDVLKAAIGASRGQVVSTPGDFVLAGFSGADDAVAAALAGQRQLANRNASTDSYYRATWRIGIAYGDVFAIGGDIYGHAVNVAARIQSLARPGEILVTDGVERMLSPGSEYAIENLGTQRLKNIADPVGVFRISAPGARRSEAPDYGASDHSDLKRRLRKPVIRIEPFLVLDESQPKILMARAIGEELHIVLSRLTSSITVIDSESIGRTPPVDYVLKAAIQGAGRHIRIMARLVSTTDGSSMWAERYDCDLAEGFELQDDIAREIVVALQLALTEGEQARFWRRGTKSGRAWEHFQLGRDQEGRYTRDGHRNAIHHYEQALKDDPTYISALVALGFCHVDNVRLGWTDEVAGSLREAERAFERANAVDAKHPDVLSLLAFIRVLQGRRDEAVAAMQAAVLAAGSNAEIIGYQGALHDLLGDFASAIRCYKRALSLSHHVKPWIGSNLGLSYLANGSPAEAEKIYRLVLEQYPRYARAWIGLSVALVRQDRSIEARSAAARVIELDPQFTVSKWGHSRPFSDETLLLGLMNDMLSSGLPE
jgi:adenylate cyclase